MNAGWMPPSAHDSAYDLVWLPRLLQKARRSAAAASGGAGMMNGYLYGESDIIDAGLLRFLRIGDRDVSALVADHTDDATVARIVVERSGTTPEERRAFSTRFRKQYFDFVLTEADEGRLPPGLKRTAIVFVYNVLMMPVLRVLYRRAERARSAR